jgi:hypothetical protein
MMEDRVNARWRTGRKLGRTVYAMVGDDPSDADEFLGIMETPTLADVVVYEHNEALR